MLEGEGDGLGEGEGEVEVLVRRLRDATIPGNRKTPEAPTHNESVVGSYAHRAAAAVAGMGIVTIGGGLLEVWFV
mgnify:CR=1 FL=1